MPPRKSRSSIPRPLDPSLISPPALYKAGMYSELQKLGQDHDRAIQLILSEQPDLSRERAEVHANTAGLELTVEEDKALSAIQILLDRTGYQGNLAGREAHFQEYGWTGTLPRLIFTRSEFYEAYGLERAGDGYFHGAQVDRALEALKSLASKERTLAFQWKVWRETGGKRKQVERTVVLREPIISLSQWQAYEDLTEQEISRVLAGQTVEEKEVGSAMILEPRPILMLGIQEGFFSLLPTSLYREIEDVVGSARYSAAIPRFLRFLNTLDKPTIQIRATTLTYKLRLDYLLRQRKPKRLETRLKECLKVALETGFLLEWSEDPLSPAKDRLYHLTLNPERCLRIKRRPSLEAESSQTQH